MRNRYEASGNQAEFQPGSDGKVLSNLLGITSPAQMDDIELDLLDQLYQNTFSEEFPNRHLKISDLKSWHHQWLGNVYAWAGELRIVNVAKSDFHFAAAAQIPRLLEKFQEACLNRFTPTYELDDTALAEALAVTHVELILIHPFREGNGRLARLLTDVMAVQAERGLLDYSAWDKHKDRYIAAIQQGLAREYGLMMELVGSALRD